MEYVVFKASGKQYKAAVGDKIKVEAKIGEKSKTVEFDEVLLHVADSNVKIGRPSLDGKVVGSVVEQGKGKKVRIQTYKAKGGQHRSAGHRQDQTIIKIESIRLK